MERAVDYSVLVDGTSFGTVRRYLRHARSPDRGVLFVASPELLAETASLLDARSSIRPALRQRQVGWLFRNGQVRVGGDAAAERNSLAVDLERVADDAYCQVIYLPPLYLVHVPELGLHPLSRPMSAWQGP